ncbi:MAG: hypothetical protein ACYCYI_04760 [Saccharofermentanales bacterium]
MKKLTTREIVLLIILVIAIVGAGYYNIIFKPYLADNEEISAKIDEVKSDVNALKLKKASIKMIDDKIAGINNEMKDEFAHMLYSIDNASILMMFTKTLPPSATLTEITFHPDYQDLQNSYITTIDVNFRCNRAGFSTVLRNLKNAVYTNRVIKSNLKATTPGVDAYDASISVEFITKSVIPTKTDFPQIYP